MARAYGPQGIHVAHVVVDGGIAGDKIIQGLPQFAQAMGEDGLISLEGLADAYWFLYSQPRSGLDTRARPANVQGVVLAFVAGPEREIEMAKEVCVVAGVGPGTGAALSRRFAAGGYRVAMLARDAERLAALEREIDGSRGYAVDVTDARAREGRRRAHPRGARARRRAASTTP